MLIDTFLFSEPHEADLMWLKFKLEDPFVDMWIIQECDHTIQGHYKGCFAEEVLSQERFKPYLQRIQIARHNGLIGVVDNTEHSNYVRENTQRTFCGNILMALPDEAMVMVSDMDEMVDFTSDKRFDRFTDIVGRHLKDFCFLGRMRYWFDYDNRCYLPNIRIPIMNLGFMKQNGLERCLSSIRHQMGQHPGRTYDAHESPIAFEYSYVFKSIEELWRKKSTYPHINFDRECLEIALKYNHWPRTDKRGEKVGETPHDFFEIVELTEENSPTYVRENLTKLKTNIVNPEYKKLRLEK
jgi:hypothetical protein